MAALRPALFDFMFSNCHYWVQSPERRERGAVTESMGGRTEVSVYFLCPLILVSSPGAVCVLGERDTMNRWGHGRSKEAFWIGNCGDINITGHKLHREYAYNLKLEALTVALHHSILIVKYLSRLF